MENLEEMKHLSLMGEKAALDWFNGSREGWTMSEDVVQHEGHTTRYLRRTWSKPLASGLGKRFWTATVAVDRKTGNQTMFQFGPYDRLNHELDREGSVD